MQYKGKNKITLKGNSMQKTDKLQMKGLIVNSTDTKFDDSTHLR